MSRDYKRNDRPHGGRGSGSSLLVGILIGLVLGLCVALGVAWYINKMPSPFPSRVAPPPKSEAPRSACRRKPRGATNRRRKPRKSRASISTRSCPAQRNRRRTRQPAINARVNPRRPGDVLPPGGRVSERGGRRQPQGAPCAARDRGDHRDDEVADKGIWHRVRVGPYTSVEELNRTRDTLKQNGVQTTLVKLREPER